MFTQIWDFLNRYHGIQIESEKTIKSINNKENQLDATIMAY